MAETETKAEGPQATDTGKRAEFWLAELEKAGKREKKWRDEGTRIVQRYRGDKKNLRSYNILYANTELLKPTILSRTPKVDVQQRYKADSDPAARLAGELLERAVNFSTDDPNFFYTEQLEKARDDMLLPGRGVCRVVYEREIKRRELFADTDDDGNEIFTLDGELADPDEIDDDGNAFREDITRQDVFLQYVYWKDYREGDARCWEDVPWVSYRHLLTRKEGIKQFGDKFKTVTLPIGKDTSKQGNKTDSGDEPEAPMNRAVVWEIWDKDNRERVWVAEGHDSEVLDTEDDPLGIQNFFAQPEPLRSISSTDKRTPIPEFRIYKDQADELDKVTMRIDKLIDAIKARGIYAAVLEEMKDIYSGVENELIPITNWASVQDKGGLKGSIEFTPIEQYANVLQVLYNQRKELKQEIFEITGLSDIIRGQTDPRETATAQKTKAQFGTMRLNPRQVPMERFIRTIFRIKAEIIGEHFTAGHLEEVTGLAPTPEAMQLLRNDKVRSYNVDIESDTTVVPDQQKEQAQATEFLAASSNFIAAAGTAALAAPEMTPLFLSMYKAAARRFKMGRELETEIDSAVNAVADRANQPQQEQPDPDAEKAKADIQLKQQQAQVDAEFKKADLQMKREELEANMQLKMQDAEVQAQAKLREIETRSELERVKIAETSELEREKQAALMQLEREKQDAEFALKQRSAELEIQLKRDIAELDAQTRQDESASRRSDLDIRRNTDSAANDRAREQSGQKPVVVNLNIPESSKRKITLDRDSDGKLAGAEVNEG